VPSILDIPVELLMLGLRLLLIAALYGFLAMVIREIHRDWKRAPRAPAPAFGLVVARSSSENIPVGQTFELRRLTTIGRMPDATVRLNDEHISARHAEIARTANGSWLLRDAGSTNGTQLNGWAVDGQVTVRPGDLIQVGTVTLRLEAMER
jgi:pSer/pThr/pTyr-binding forkhead associated (FHA) protein